MMNDPVAAVDARIATKLAERRRLLTLADTYADKNDPREWNFRKAANLTVHVVDALLDERLRLMVIYRGDYVETT